MTKQERAKLLKIRDRLSNIDRRLRFVEYLNGKRRRP